MVPPTQSARSSLFVWRPRVLPPSNRSENSSEQVQISSNCGGTSIPRRSIVRPSGPRFSSPCRTSYLSVLAPAETIFVGRSVQWPYSFISSNERKTTDRPATEGSVNSHRTAMYVRQCGDRGHGYVDEELEDPGKRAEETVPNGGRKRERASPFGFFESRRRRGHKGHDGGGTASTLFLGSRERTSERAREKPGEGDACGRREKCPAQSPRAYLGHSCQAVDDHFLYKRKINK